MKIRVAESTGCPVPQFIVEAENDQERLILKSFVTFSKDKWKFHLHGFSSNKREGVASFNFGWTKDKIAI